jgi:hypothetical protein
MIIAQHLAFLTSQKLYFLVASTNIFIAPFLNTGILDTGLKYSDRTPLPDLLPTDYFLLS